MSLFTMIIDEESISSVFEYEDRSIFIITRNMSEQSPESFKNLIGDYKLAFSTNCYNLVRPGLAAFYLQKPKYDRFHKIHFLGNLSQKALDAGVDFMKNLTNIQKLKIPDNLKLQSQIDYIMEMNVLHDNDEESSEEEAPAVKKSIRKEDSLDESLSDEVPIKKVKKDESSGSDDESLSDEVPIKKVVKKLDDSDDDNIRKDRMHPISVKTFLKLVNGKK